MDEYRSDESPDLSVVDQQILFGAESEQRCFILEPPANAISTKTMILSAKRE